MANSPYHQNNAAMLERLREFAARATQADLCHPMPAGWTVSAVLAHLAFWDTRAITLIRQWQAGGITPSPIDVDVINEVSRPLCLAIEPRAALELTLRCAAEVDALIEASDPAFLRQIETDGQTVHLNRGEHRRTHLTEIYQVLGWAPDAQQE